MKQFIKKVIGFLLGFSTLLAVVLFYIVKTHEFQPEVMYYSQDFNNAFHHKKPYKLISIGNSKSLSAIDKQTLEEEMGTEVGRLGYMGSDVSTTRLIFESYLNHCTEKPQVVFFEVSWGTFNKEKTFFHLINGDLFLLDPNLWKRGYKYFPEIIQSIRTSVENNLRSKYSKKSPVNYDAYVVDSSPSTKDYEFDLPRFEFAYPNHIAGVHPLLFEDYQAILDLCELHNIELVLYNAPEDEVYVNLQIDRQEILTIFRENKKNEYIDFTMGSPLYRKDFELWMQDHNHINERDLFTKVLTDEIKRRGISIK